MRKRVLWIEDGAHDDFSELAAPLLNRRDVETVVAASATEAIEFCLRGPQFNGVLVDIRLPPGFDPAWIALNKRLGSRSQARLGLEVIKTLLGLPVASICLERRLAWLTANMVGVLTVEPKAIIEPTLREWGITTVFSKNTDFDIDTELENPLMIRMLKKLALVEA